MVVDGPNQPPHMAIDVHEILDADFLLFSVKIAAPTGIGVPRKEEILANVPIEFVAR